jgi:hypothetical protein
MGIKLIYLGMNISLLHWNQFDLFVNEHFPSLKSIGSICEWTLIFTEINLTYICEWTFSFTDINLIYLWMNTSLHWKQFDIFVNEHFSFTEINLIYLLMNISRHWNQLDLFVSEHSPSLTSLWFICEWTFLVTEINSGRLFKVWYINT